MSENAGEHDDAGWSDALRSLIFPASTLVVFGVVFAATLVLWTDFRPLAAAQDAILNEHMSEQARDRPPPAPPGRVYFVAFDETACLGLAISETECQISGPIDRTYIAKLLETAHLAHPAAILFDIVPLALEGGCDEGDPTPTLIEAIHEVSQDTPVILPRALVGAGASKADGRTFLDQCPLAPEVERDFLRGDRVFFGHAMLEPTPDGGSIGAIAPWVVADMVGRGPNGLGRGSLQRRRIPAVSLIAALAMEGHSPAEMFKMLQASGLETRWRGDPDYPSAPKPLEYCAGGHGACRLAITSMSDPPEPWRLNFRFRWDPTSPRDTVAIERAQTLTVIGAGRFNDLRTEKMHAEHSVIIAAPTLPDYKDIHFTPIGPQPGGIVHVNALFSFTNDSFLRSHSPFENFLDELKHLLIFTLEAVVLALLLAWLLVALVRWRKRSLSPLHSVHMMWPIALGGLAIYEMRGTWGAMHEDFDQGVLSFSIVAIVMAAFELRVAAEDAAHVLKPFIVRGLGRFRSAPASPAKGASETESQP